jgi:ubiquinone/menaquinone biosynthesis C-methylase UbiE
MLLVNFCLSQGTLGGYYTEMAHDYNSFATVYDLVMGTRVNEAKYLRNLIKKHAPNAKKLLELGCGSGSLIEVLQKSYSCIGIDLSSEMVKVARKKVPRSQFIVGDITSFDIDEKFDVIVCAFDTINHVLNFSKWRQIFRRAHSHLNQGGVFIFDINTKLKLERYVSEPPFTEATDKFISIVDAVKKGPNKYQLEIKALTKNKSGSFDLVEMKVPEVTFPTEKIKTALSKYFRRIELCDAERLRPSVKTEELFFICSRPR